MIDLHTHTFFSDGALIASELARRAAVAGYTAIALTDHCDCSNYKELVAWLVRAAEQVDGKFDIRVVPGVELTHVPPEDTAWLVQEVRSLGARIVAVHGETVTEPVVAGTNRAALEAGVDFLAHPGLICSEDAEYAAEKDIPLEITTRRGHSYTNGHVLQRARAAGARMIINNDAHAPGDLLGKEMRTAVARGAGMTEEEIAESITTAGNMINAALK